MKKLIVILLVLTVAFSAFAQAQKEAAASTKPTVRLLTDATGIDDKSFNAAAWRGIVDFYGETVENPASKGTLYDVITAASADMYIPNLKNAADQGYDLIIVTGFTWADALGEVAPLYPNQKFMIVDVDWLSGANIRQYIYGEEQGSYLVGVAAAMQAKADGIENPKFGFIGGVPSATITKFEVGYVMGVLSVFPNAEIVDYYANDWGKPELAKAQAKAWYDNGVYCIFSAAGGTGNGTIAQAKEYRMAGKNVWAIGVDSDQYSDGIYEGTKSSVLTSMLKLVENSTLDALQKIEAGAFEGVVVQMDMVDGGVGYSAANPELSDAAKAACEQAKADIISGKIKVYKTYKEALAAGAVPAGLSALDD
ncbi:MAG: BMP family ABC transporter substrate-binding protein [Spirochaetales bacterium]|nr:BMP family ABC transporter substrate-binding protein [Spirochaetales bacterium]